jgi:hypothetical protein
MGILSVIKTDVEELVHAGYPDEYISKSVGIDLNMIEYIIQYIRQQEKEKSPRINNKDSK